MAAAHTSNPVGKSRFAKTEKVAVGELVVALKGDKGKTYEELAAVMGAHKRVVAQWITMFRRKGLVRIVGWTRDGRGHLRIAQWGWDELRIHSDVPRPKYDHNKYRRDRRAMMAANDMRMTQRIVPHTQWGPPNSDGSLPMD